MNWRTGKCIKLPAHSPHAQVGLADFFILLSSFCSHRGAEVTTLAQSLLEASLLKLLNTIAKYNICSGKNPHLAGAVILHLYRFHDLIIIRAIAN